MHHHLRYCSKEAKKQVKFHRDKNLLEKCTVICYDCSVFFCSFYSQKVIFVERILEESEDVGKIIQAQTKQD